MTIVNKQLINFCNDITSVGASSRGNNFDETVLDKLKKHLPKAKFVSTETFCSKDKDSIYKDYSKITHNNVFDFSQLPTIIDNNKELNLMIVDKPNGSQKWPDLLVINNGIGLPIEVKSSKNDKIVWNCSLPKPNSLYIFNCYGKSKTTCFLGQHAISKNEVDFLKEITEETIKFNVNNERWGYYVRNMFNSNQRFFKNEETRLDIENNTKEYLSTLPWNNSQTITF